MYETYLDRVLGEEGIKTEVTINLKTSTYVNLGATIIFSMIVGGLLMSIVKKTFGR